MTPRALSFVAVALLAVGASAAVSMSKSWRLTRDDGTGTTSVSMTETPEGVELLTWGKSRFEAVKLTKEEAASLGRALLEAAGGTRKEGPWCARTPDDGVQGCCVGGDIGSLRIP